MRVRAQGLMHRSAASQATRAATKTAAPRHPDGRSCKLCGEKDNSHDPVAAANGIPLSADDGESLRTWCYPPAADGKTSGSVRWYCYRTWLGKYKVRNFTITTLVQHVGAKDEHFEEFQKYLNALIDHFVQKKSRAGKMPWSETPDLTLTLTEAFESRFESPNDQYWLKSYYLEHKGDPKSNGLGHKEVVRGGKEFVIIPGRSRSRWAVCGLVRPCARLRVILWLHDCTAARLWPCAAACACSACDECAHA